MGSEKNYTISQEAYKNKLEYISRYSKDKYERITLHVPVGRKAYYRELAQSKGVSLNQLFLSAVEQIYGE